MNNKKNYDDYYGDERKRGRDENNIDALFEENLNSVSKKEKETFRQSSNREQPMNEKLEEYAYSDYARSHNRNKYNKNNNNSNHDNNHYYENTINKRYEKNNDNRITDDNYYFDNSENSYKKNYHKNNYNQVYDNYYSRENQSKKKIKKSPNEIQKEKVGRIIQKIQNKAPEFTYNLINELITEDYDCMICNESVKQVEETWSCEKCFTIYHVNCINNWIKKLNSDILNEKISKMTTIIFKWSCPHCSNNFTAVKENLPKYNCFCKKFFKAEEGYKKHNPEFSNFDPDLIPHGCGINCGKKICKHLTCNLPCHPGPHLQCNQNEILTCYCGNSTKEVACSSLVSSFSINKFICDKICEKELNCKRHKCQLICHEGDCLSLTKLKKCEDCLLEAKYKFQSFIRNIEKKIFKDTKIEVKLRESITQYIFHGQLSCKIHFEEINTNEKLKFLINLIKISGENLIENLKTFVPKCKEIVLNSCLCGSKSTKTECYKLNFPDDIIEFLNLGEDKEKALSQCKKACNSLKSCKIHNCERICCELANVKIINYSLEDPLGLHLCMNICGKDLNCGKHECENYCHRGNCLPCRTIIRDGESSCNCGNTIIKAPFICGTKPTCNLPCLKLRNCPHSCPLNCHDNHCPKCQEMVIKNCVCKKTLVENCKCGDEIIPTCMKICEEILPCGVHFCDLVCHDHTKEFDEKYYCNLQCGRTFAFCKHSCLKKCHGESDCNELLCEIKIKITCKCKVFSKEIKCGEVKKKSNNFTEEYFLDCNEQCKKIERLKKIETAFDGLFKYNQQKSKELLKGKKSESKNEKNKNNLIIRKGFIPNNGDDDNNKNEIIKESNLNENLQSDKCENLIKLEGNEDEEFLLGKFVDIKYSYYNIFFTQKNINFVIDIENKIERALKNLTEQQEINSLNKKQLQFTTEFLKCYYNIEFEVLKKPNDPNFHLQLKNCQDAKIPRIRLSLIALTLKNKNFMKIPPLSDKIFPNKNKVIFHPFEKSLYIQDYRLHITVEMVDVFISNIVPVWNYYVHEITPGQCYVHFFDKFNCDKVFKELKNKTNQFQDCYEVDYYYDENWNYKDFYLYLKDDVYFSYLNNFFGKLDESVLFTKTENKFNDDETNKLDSSKKGKEDINRKEIDEIDDGFILIKKKKK